MADIFKGKWHEIKGKVREKWGKLTHDDIEQINGRRENLLGKLQSRYGWQQKQADEELKRFERSLQGERGQKISAEYESEEEISDRGVSSERKTSRNEERPSKEKKPQKFEREYFERSEEEERERGSDEDQDFPKRKVR